MLLRDQSPPPITAGVCSLPRRLSRSSAPQPLHLSSFDSKFKRFVGVYLYVNGVLQKIFGSREWQLRSCPSSDTRDTPFDALIPEKRLPKKTPGRNLGFYI